MTVTQWFEIVNANFDESMSYQGSKDDPNSNYSRICRALNGGLENLGNFKCTNGTVHVEGQPIVQPTRPIVEPTRPIVEPTRPIVPPTRPIMPPTMPVGPDPRYVAPRPVTPRRSIIDERVAGAHISISGNYIGPDYTLPLSNLELLGGSKTYDNARGSQTVRWMDYLGITHEVHVGDHQQKNVYFPNIHGDWNWLDGDGWEVTRFNEACKWIQATFQGKPGNWH